MVTPMLSIIPICRMVAKVAEATPRNCLLTELMTAFVLGEEKSAKPKPKMIKPAMMNGSGVSLLNKANPKSPRVVKAIPPRPAAAVRTDRIVFLQGERK